MTNSICEVCCKNESIGVASVPGVPISCAYCTECLQANAHPYDIIVANTACIGGFEHAADWWKQMVKHTLIHLNKTKEQFENDVNKSISSMEIC